MSEAQLGYRAYSVSGMDTGEACKPLKIFQNEHFMSVLNRNFGQEYKDALYHTGLWLRDRSDDYGTRFCAVSFSGTPASLEAPNELCRVPIILLK